MSQKKVIISVTEAIDEFQLDPMSRPNFEVVFNNQHFLISVISMSLFMRILYLIITFSVLNSIKGLINNSCRKTNFTFSRLPIDCPHEYSDIYLAYFHDSVYSIVRNRRLHFSECLQDWCIPLIFFLFV